MTQLEIWAPDARTVEIVVGDARRRAERGEDGTWRAPAPPVGADYAISIDGGPPRPDPRSRQQPHGVHGPSRVVADDFPWTDHGFRPPPLATGLVYELHVGTFTPRGTFDGVIERLDELVRLGVTHVELLPVAEFPGLRGWGYDGVCLYAAHGAYGGVDGLRRLVDAAHARGLAVILDVVYNHLGPDGNYLGELGPYFTDRYHTPWGDAIDFDGPRSAGVRRFFLDNARFWLRDCHLDGLRLDATHAIFDASPRHILAELAELAHGLGDKVLIAENEHYEPRLYEPGGWGIDAFWYDELHHAIHAALTGERGGYYAPFGAMSDVATALVAGAAAGARGDQCIGCIQNHDQVGNRAIGERLGHLISPGRLRLAAALLLTSPMVPMLFQGEEWNASAPFQYFTDHTSPELAQAVRDGRRAEHAAFVGGADHVPDPQDPATMRRSMLDWDERDRDGHREVLAWYQALIALRRGRADLLDGRRDRVDVTADDDARTIIVRRGGVTVVGNAGDAPARLPTPPGEVLLAYPEAPRDGVVPPDGVAIYVVP